MSLFPNESNIHVKTQQISDRINGLLDYLVEQHKELWDEIWENPDFTPDEIFEAFGAYGQTALFAGTVCVQLVTSVAAYLESTPEQIFGDAKYLTTKYPVVVGEDGTVTVELP